MQEFINNNYANGMPEFPKGPSKKEEINNIFFALSQTNFTSNTFDYPVMFSSLTSSILNYEENRHRMRN